MRPARFIIVVLTLAFAFSFSTTAATQEKLPASKVHGFLDIFQMLEESSFYDMTKEEMVEFHHCAMRKIFMAIKIPKGTTLQEDFVIESCFSKDKHASYYSPEDMERMKRERAGKFFGIGISVKKVPEGLYIINLVPRGPAEKAGTLQPGDIIIAIAVPESAPNVEVFIPIKDMPINKALKLIRGPDNTDVVFKILRDNTERVVLVRRGPVEQQVIESRLLDQEIGYLKLKTFMKEEMVKEDILPVLQKFQANGGVRALVIDLRNNTGGDMRVTFQFLELFSPGKDRVIVEVRYRTKPPFIQKTTKEGPFSKLKLVVLVNGYSASASELSAGVLQLWGATVAGVETFKKGSVQPLQPISDGGTLRFTVAKFYFENGETPDEKGITPDIVVENPKGNGAEDLQLIKAVEHLRGKLQANH